MVSKVEKIEIDTEIKIPDYLIMNKDTYNPNSKRNEKLIGAIKTKKPVDVNKIIDEVRQMEY